MSVLKSVATQGYSTDYILSSSDLACLQQYVKSQWLSVIHRNNPDLYESLCSDNVSLSDYHKYSFLIDHHTLWPKTSRILPETSLHDILDCELFAYLSNVFGDYCISDEDNLGYPNIYWRLVRPNEPSDVGPLHRDSWFWKLNTSFPTPSYPFKRIKVWIALHVESGLNGLLVSPLSHLRDDIRWSSEHRHGIHKPVLETDLSDISTHLIPCEPGQVIIFHDDLIHGGSINSATTTRVSMEFTLIIRA